jgi:hypothetical protein
MNGGLYVAIPDDKERFSFILEKSIKHKLQILADAENKPLGNYIATILKDHVIAFENNIAQTYGGDEFEETYISIFGNEYPPASSDIAFDEEDTKRKIINKLKIVDLKVTSPMKMRNVGARKPIGLDQFTQLNSDIDDLN